MYTESNMWAKQKAFTLVELLVVIAIIGILASMTIAGSNIIRTDAAKKQASSELTVVQSLFQREFRKNNEYPTAIPADYAPTQNATVTYKSGSITTYCLEATVANQPSVQFYANSQENNGEIKEGVCPTP